MYEHAHWDYIVCPRYTFCVCDLVNPFPSRGLGFYSGDEGGITNNHMTRWRLRSARLASLIRLPTQRKNLIDLGHDLGNRDQDKVDPGQEARS